VTAAATTVVDDERVRITTWRFEHTSCDELRGPERSKPADAEPTAGLVLPGKGLI
jgi:hypothetical protein